MIFWLMVDGRLERCRLTDDRDVDVLAMISAMSSSCKSHDTIEMLRGVRKGFARLIVESGKFIVVEQPS